MDYKFNNNWREKVAAMTEIDDVDIEKTFSDLASGFVSNKVGDLMKDQHRIGFEIVKKNEDNTRMLGVFAFKVDKELIFAPVFFLQGEIKGPLLYRCDTKQFIPATKDWANYLIESIETTDGRGIDKTKMGDTAPMVSLDKIMMRPKQANVNTSKDQHEAILKDAIEQTKKTLGENVPAEEFNAEVNKTYEKIVNEKFSVKKAFTYEFGQDFEEGLLRAIRKSASFQPGILKEFLSEEGYGLMAAEALVKASSADSPRLAEHLANLYGDPRNVIPSELKDFKKEASAPVRKLEVHFGFTKEAAENSKQYFKDGFFFFDQRYSDDCTKVTKDPVHSNITSVTDAGLYDLVREDGTMQKDVFCAHVVPTCGTLATKNKWLQDPKAITDYIIAVDKQGYTSVYKNVLGINKLNATIEKFVETDKELPGVTELQRGGVYIAYVKGNDSATAPFYVIDKRTSDGVSFCKVKFLNVRHLYEDSGDLSNSHIWWSNGDYHKVICNRDATSNYEKGIFGNDVKFIKVNASTEKDRGLPGESECINVKIKRLQNIADGSQANEWVFDKFNVPTVDLAFDKAASHPYTLTDLSTGEVSANMNKLQIMTKLAKDLKISAPVAYDLTESAEANNNCVFTIEGLNKLASRIHIVGRPRFTEEMDQATGIPISENQSFILDTAGVQEFDNRPHVGDAMNPTTATGLPNMTVVTTAPDQLRGLADSYNLPNVFEHGAVGALADTFDANTLLNKYLPKLQEAVDCLGRIKFLFYWKPNDFQKSYGADDMTNLGAEIDSNFESIGELTLKLQKKSDKSRNGAVSTKSELD